MRGGGRRGKTRTSQIFGAHIAFLVRRLWYHMHPPPAASAEAMRETRAAFAGNSILVGEVLQLPVADHVRAGSKNRMSAGWGPYKCSWIYLCLLLGRKFTFLCLAKPPSSCRPVGWPLVTWMPLKVLGARKCRLRGQRFPVSTGGVPLCVRCKASMGKLRSIGEAL